jgi:hypothetical protein
LARPVLISLAVLTLLLASAARAADDPDADALSLGSAPVESAQAQGGTRLFIEGAIGRADQRFEPGWRNIGRVSLDLSSSIRLGADWRAIISDRLDVLHPADPGRDRTVNSLREAYVSWQQGSGATLVDLGRVNLRYGPGYGYNPTDFFRDNTLRTMTTVNPLALRENRLGTFVLRGQRLWGDTGVSLAYAPKLANRASTDGASIDAGATNNRSRALATLSTRLSERISGQVLAYDENGLPPQFGASATALLADAIVAYAEGARAREPDLLARAQQLGGPRGARNRFVGGVTVTPFPRLSVTAEYQYNGFALDKAGWAAASAGGPTALGGYLLEAQRRQELASRQAWFAYATLKDAGTKNLDLTALLRVDANQRSRLGWIELRYHWARVDLALQYQQQSGNTLSEYGLAPYRRSVQLLASHHLN